MRSPFMLAIIAGCACLAVAAPSVQALPSHTWVGTNGNDAGPGNQGHPFLTLAHAVANTAAGGLISVVGSGDMGAATIDNSITIDGTGADATIQSAGGGVAITVQGSAPGEVVVLRHLTLDGAGTGADGIRCETTGEVVVEDCKIEGFGGSPIEVSTGGALDVKNSTLIGGSNGIDLEPSTVTSMTLTNTDIKGTPVIGIRVQGPTMFSVTDCRIDGAQAGVVTGVGIAVAGSFDRVRITRSAGDGLSINSGNVDIRDSVITQNGSAGLDAAFGAEINAAGNTITNNRVGVMANSPSTVRLLSNNLFNNGTAYGNGGGALLTDEKNHKGGNGNGQPGGTITGTVSAF